MWSSLLIYVAGRLLRPLLSSWIGVAWFTGGLATVFFLMQVFILFTQSERSTPAKTRKSAPASSKAVVNGQK
jgi:lysophosphatidic acid acyltransferase/lysophosphatidylinositol acyltransferase